MAIAHVGTYSNILNGNGSSFTYDFTVTIGSGANRVTYILWAAEFGRGMTSAQWLDGGSQPTSTEIYGGNVSNSRNLRIARIINPTAGTNTMRLTLNLNDAVGQFHIVTLSGVDQTTPDTTPAYSSGTSTAAAHSLSPSSADQWMFGLCLGPASITGNTATLVGTEQNNGFRTRPGYRTGVTGANDLSFTMGSSVAWDVGGFLVNAAADATWLMRNTKRWFMAPSLRR